MATTWPISSFFQRVTAGGGGVGWGLLVVEESDGVAGRSNLPRKVSVVFSESKF